MISNIYFWNYLWHLLKVCWFNTLTAVKTWFFLSLVFSIPNLLAVSFFISIFLSLSILVSVVFFLVFFVLKYSIPCLHVSADGTLSVFHSNFLFGVFGHCKASWVGEMCLSLSLHARLYLCQDFNPECHVKIKCLIDCFCLFLTYIFWFCTITLFLPGSSSSCDVSCNLSNHLLGPVSASFFLLVS